MAQPFNLTPDEFAFYFDTESGVDADALATFLKRATVVAKRHGGVLQVTGLRHGSLLLKLRAIAQSKVVKNARKEFVDKPIDGTVKVTGLVGAIVGAIVYVMSPEKSGITPMNRAGADITEKCGVDQILIVTNMSQTLIMDRAIAHQVRARESSANPYKHADGAISHTDASPQGANLRASPEVHRIMHAARAGTLWGTILAVGAELHFKPDGFRYTVPVEFQKQQGGVQLKPGAHVQVMGALETLHGQPDRLVITNLEILR